VLARWGGGSGPGELRRVAAVLLVAEQPMIDCCAHLLHSSRAPLPTALTTPSSPLYLPNPLSRPPLSPTRHTPTHQTTTHHPPPTPVHPHGHHLRPQERRPPDRPGAGQQAAPRPRLHPQDRLRAPVRQLPADDDGQGDGLLLRVAAAAQGVGGGAEAGAHRAGAGGYGAVTR